MDADGRQTAGGKTVLLAARSAVALHRLLDVLPVFAGDARVTRRFALVPGSEFGVDALSAVTAAGARTVPWDTACRRPYDLILTASPKGELRLLHGSRVLLPHGAGFSKSIAGEGSADSASGLDPAYLSPSGEDLVLYALAHPRQVEQLAGVSPRAARHARVVGDPTLERLLASRPLRDAYRSELGTGARRLVVLTSTWGRESLLHRNPRLPAELAARLPHDEFQLALIVHPNEWDRLSAFELRQHMAPALDAGMVLAGPYEEWAALLIAGDALVTDHGSAALYFSAVRDRPVVNAYGGGEELLPGSPMDRLLCAVPALESAAGLCAALAAYRPGAGRAAERSAFAEHGRGLELLRSELYRVLGLDPPEGRPVPRLLPPPLAAAGNPAAFDVHTRLAGHTVTVRRIPAGLGPPGHHLAVEHGASGEHFARTAGLLYRRALPAPSAPHRARWTAAAWTGHALSEYPGCRTAAAVPAAGPCVLRIRDDARTWSVRVAAALDGGRVTQADPAAALSAVHTWLIAHGRLPEQLTCAIGERAFRVTLSPATTAEAELPL